MATGPRVDSYRETPFGVEQLAYALADQLKPEGDERFFDVVVGIGVAGMTVANTVARVLQPEGRLNAQFAAVDTNVDEVTGKLLDYQFGQTPIASDVNNRRVVLLDAVCRTGHSLSLVSGYLRGCGPAELVTGVLYYRGPLVSGSNFVPDVYAMGPKIITAKSNHPADILEAEEAQGREYEKYATQDVKFPWNTGRPASAQR